jgi:hypothetical protein
MRKISALEGGDISFGMYVCESLHFPYVQCTMYNVKCKMYNVQCTMYNVQCTMYYVQCTKHNLQSTCMWEGGWDVPCLHTEHDYGYQLLLSQYIALHLLYKAQVI